MTSLSNFCASLEPEEIWHGNHTGNDRRITLHAGSLSMIYENGNLRYISDGKNELIRMIYPAVRDREWLTISPEILEETIEADEDSFRIEYRCLYSSGEIKFSARYQIGGNPDNTIGFSFEGEALSTFEKSRIGFCVLHPIEGCSGNPCTITHSDGNSESLVFPVHISPGQPFSDIKSMSYKVGGSECRIVFSGDIFETEDQRNWTDASYKTYCTPLSMPCPATIRKGEKLSQRIEIELTEVEKVETPEDEEIRITLNPMLSSVIPSLGTGRSTRPSPLTEEEAGILRDLCFDHYRADIYLFTDSWVVVADQALAEAAALNYSLELAIFFDGNYPAQLESFIGWMISREPPTSVISLFHRSEPVIPHNMLLVVAPRLKEVLPDVRIVCGTNANFAEINRRVPESVNTDLICYSLHPQEHASDNTTLVENIQSQSYTVESSREFAGGRGIWISPVNIRRRFNANVENFEPQVISETFPPQADSRLMSIFGACWTAGSLKYLCEAGVDGITLYETAGERGIIQGSFDSRWPEEFKAVKKMIFPVFHLLAWLLNDKSYRVIRSSSTRPLEVECLALAEGNRARLALANFSSSDKIVIIKGLSGEIKRKVLNINSFPESAADPGWISKEWESSSQEGNHFMLAPCSLNFIEGLLQ